MGRLTRILGPVIRALATVVVTMVIIICVVIAEILVIGLFVLAEPDDTLGWFVAKLAIFLALQPVAYRAVCRLLSGKRKTQGVSLRGEQDVSLLGEDARPPAGNRPPRWSRFLNPRGPC